MTRPATTAECLALVAPAEEAFHSRWRLSSLKQVDADLHDALIEQRDLASSSCVVGTDADAKMHAEAMVRGWAAACAAMQSQPHDAYLYGMDAASGVQVVIAEHKASRDILAERYGEPLVLMTPNEVAMLLAGWKILSAAKQAFPDAEICGLTPATLSTTKEGLGG